MYFCLKSGNYTVGNWRLMQAAMYIVQNMETMCFCLKSGNYTVRNYEILKNKVNASIHTVKKTWKQCVAILNQVTTKYEIEKY